MNCPKCKEEIEKIIDSRLPNYSFGAGLGGHKDTGREGFIERLAQDIINAINTKE